MTVQLINNPYNKTYNQTGSCFGLFDTKLTDHVLEGQDAVGWALQGSLITMVYSDAVKKVKELYANGTDTEYRGITCKRSSDGRYIADVSQKDAVDKLFNSSGTADFYILDSVSNQFYLPRSKWFRQLTLDTNLVNGFNEAGLPDILGKIEGIGSTFSLFDPKVHTSGACSDTKKTAQLGTHMDVGNGDDSQIEIDIKGSNSSSVYGSSDTVQPASSNKLLYYKVGNTVINESLIDIGKVLAELQLKADKDLSNASPSQSFKNQSVGWGMPDYLNPVHYSSLNVTTTADKDSVLIGFVYVGQNAGDGHLYLYNESSQQIKDFVFGYNTNQVEKYYFTVPVLKGYSFKITSTYPTVSADLYPLKGVN